MHFLAEVRFYASERKFLPEKGYRPDAIFSGCKDYRGITFIDLESKQFDTPVLAKVVFTFQDIHYQEIVIGQAFKIMEGGHQVGEGQIVSIKR